MNYALSFTFPILPLVGVLAFRPQPAVALREKVRTGLDEVLLALLKSFLVVLLELAT